AERQAQTREAPPPGVDIARAGEGLRITNRYQIPVQVVVVASTGRRVDALVPALETTTAPFAEVPPEATWRHAVVLGDPDAEHQPGRPYRVPFAVSARYRVSQGFHGGITHLDASSTFAVDIAMPVGTGIVAARAGLVIETAYAHFASLADDPQGSPPANLVRILHNDGTHAVYAHLDRASVRVKPGQRVRRGELIAASGNTGFSTGPHLHFAVLRNAGLETRSVAFEFEGAGGEGVVPQQGAWLEAYP
ncbi:MAG: M23 family metallopeptidase, partial [Pseudomonadota bacterium]